MSYQPIPKIPDFPALEQRILDFWDQREIFDKLRKQISGGEPWSFLDGPITANNPMGVHHAWGRSYKDMFQRYHAMNGRDLRYQNGFDCQGLWVEVEVEKALGFDDRNDVEDYGLAEFVKRCKERVLTFAARQTEQSIRLGYWCDWDDPDTLRQLAEAMHEGADEVTVTLPSAKTVTDHPERIVGKLGSPEYGGSYFTFSDENNYTIWSFLKKCHDEGFLYRGTDVMPWCTRCGTGLSQMEVAEGRKITSHTSVFVRFPIRERENEALLVWTTTPWTLTSNVAAAVNPEMTYLKVRHGDWTLYMGKENFERNRVQDLEAAGQKETHKLQALHATLKGSAETEVLGELKGEELVGLTFDGPFDHLDAASRPGGIDPYQQREGEESAVDAHRVIPWDMVSGAEGTGIVHIAPGCGAEDGALGREHHLPVIAPLAADGRYIDGFGEFTGVHVLEVADQVVQDLRDRGLLVAKESYPHVYPHCWRCKQELVFRLVDEWFIDMQWRDRIQKVVPGVDWIPEDGEARELDWLKNMGDWMISKKRFWGLALPIWVCGDCGEFDVLGSRDELEQRAVEGWEAFDGHTPHRPWVDGIKIQCSKCDGLSTRIKDVGNPWLDAGIVSFSTLRYNTDRDYWNQWFPADFVVESFPGQFRNWFYALLAMSAMMDGRAPFKRLLGHATVLDARGHEMHKSAGNSIAFDEAAKVMGAEVMRYMYATKNPTQNLLFPDLEEHGDGGARTQLDVRRKLLTLWNCYSFFVTYAQVDDWTPAERVSDDKLSDLDRWILSRLEKLKQSARKGFDDAQVYRFMNRLEDFFEELSNWYLRRSRRRFWAPGASDDKLAAFSTLYEVLETLVRLMAPVTPFLSEEMYQNLVASVVPDAAESVHLTSFPEVDKSRIDETLETQIGCVIRTKNLGLALRSEAQVRSRQPLSKILVRPRNDADREALQDESLARQVLEELNVKAIELIEDESDLVTTQIKPNFKTLGPKYGKHMKQLAGELSRTSAQVIQDDFDKDGKSFIQVGTESLEILPEDVETVHEGPEHLAFAFEQGMFAALDTTITPELEKEGIARDFNRHGQESRKALDLDVTDRIRVRYAAGDKIRDAVETHTDWLKTELLADAIEAVESLDEGVEAKVAGESIWLAVERSQEAAR